MTVQGLEGAHEDQHGADLDERDGVVRGSWSCMAGFVAAAVDGDDVIGKDDVVEGRWNPETISQGLALLLRRDAEVLAAGQESWISGLSMSLWATLLATCLRRA